MTAASSSRRRAARDRKSRCQRTPERSLPERDLAQKVEETCIAAQGTSGRTRLASSAVVPGRPVSRKLLTNTAIGLALGLMVGVIGVFVLEYLRGLPAVSDESHVGSDD